MVMLITNQWCIRFGDIINGKHVITLYVSLKLLDFLHMEDHRLDCVQKKHYRLGSALQRQSDWIKQRMGWTEISLIKTDTQLLGVLLACWQNFGVVSDRAGKRSPPLTIRLTI